MKISHLQEADATPSSGPDNMATGQAPKMGRSDDVLETTTSGSIATGEPSNLGTQRRGQKSIFKGIKTSKKFANSRAAGIYEDEISEEQLQAKKRREDIFKKAKDRGIGKKPVSREIMAKEAFNGEYDDEAGMADNNLETMRRAVDGIDNVISAGDNLPEWCQEKIAVAKSMLVTVWDYMRSEEEIQHGKEVDEGEVYDLSREYGADAPSRRPLPSGGSIPRRHDDEPDFMDPDQRRLRAEQERLKKANAEYYAKKNQGVAEGIFSSSENKILPLVNKISDLAGKLNPQNVEIGKKIIQSNTNDIVRMLSPQSKSGVDVIEQGVAEDWSQKYKSSINCSHPKGFSQKAHCAGKKKHNEDIAEDKKPSFMKSGNMKPFTVSGKEISGAVHTLEKALLKAKERDIKLDYNNIDKIMQAVCKKHNLTGDELHNEFVEKHHMIPDNWIVKQLDEACWKGYHKEGNKKMFGKTYPNCVKNTNEEQLDEKCWDTHKQVGMKNKGGKQVPNCVPKESVNQGVAEEQHSCPHCGGEMVSEELMNEKKDACYYKVKSRYKVWPSAYASGALVKCRKKGSANWGNGGQKSESMTVEQLEESLHDWFNKEKWVRMDTKGNIKGPCAREPGEGKPKCLPQSKAHNLGKKGRASAAQRKRREDPNPERHGKAINVDTKKKSNEGVL